MDDEVRAAFPLVIGRLKYCREKVRWRDEVVQEPRRIASRCEVRVKADATPRDFESFIYETEAAIGLAQSCENT